MFPTIQLFGLIIQLLSFFIYISCTNIPNCNNSTSRNATTGIIKISDRKSDIKNVRYNRQQAEIFGALHSVHMCKYAYE